jgi:hypothetical protein
MPERARARERERESEREQRSGGADSSVAAPATVPALRRYTGGENAMADALGTHGCHERVLGAYSRGFGIGRRTIAEGAPEGDRVCNVGCALLVRYAYRVK